MFILKNILDQNFGHILHTAPLNDPFTVERWRKTRSSKVGKWLIYTQFYWRLILKSISCLNNLIFDNFAPISVLPMSCLNNECVVLCWWQPHQWNDTIQQHSAVVWVDVREPNCHSSVQTLRSGRCSGCRAAALAQRGQHLSYWQGLFLSRAALMGLSKKPR